MPQCAVLSIRNNAAKQVLLSLGELLVRNLLLPAKSDRKNEWKLALINGCRRESYRILPAGELLRDTYPPVQSGGFLKKRFDAADRIAST
jgi:hypothetical protein